MCHTEKPKCIDEAYCASGVGKGWWPLVYHVEKLMDLICPGWVPAQVKEKYGMLCFYVDLPNPAEQFPRQDGETDNQYEARMIRIRDHWMQIPKAVETASTSICEECGQPAKTEKVGPYWVRTLCEEHFAKARERGSS